MNDNTGSRVRHSANNNNIIQWRTIQIARRRITLNFNWRAVGNLFSSSIMSPILRCKTFRKCSGWVVCIGTFVLIKFARATFSLKCVDLNNNNEFKVKIKMSIEFKVKINLNVQKK